MGRGLSAWRRALAAALATDPGRRIAARPSEIRAAVLVFLLEEPGKLDLVLERRSDDLPNHAGQFAFPGGAVDPEDRSLEETALREAWEEIGLEPSAVEILGLLSDIRTLRHHTGGRGRFGTPGAPLFPGGGGPYPSGSRGDPLPGRRLSPGSAPDPRPPDYGRGARVRG
ncbi:MAG: CoA pyrophosphatase [Acidobacteria bacterium]|nr:CoA pyrophosphatase [Acidobacteriota bacterium]